MFLLFDNYFLEPVLFPWQYKSELSGAVVDKLVKELESYGFQCFTAGIGGKGVQISFDGSSWFSSASLSVATSFSK